MKKIINYFKTHKKALSKTISFIILLTMVLYIISKTTLELDWLGKVLEVLIPSSLALSFGLTISITVNITSHGEENVDKKENHNAIKKINETLSILEKFQEKLEMNHLKNRMLGNNFIPLNPLKIEIEKISLDELKVINSELNSYKLIVKDNKIQSIINSLSNSIGIIMKDFNELKEKARIPMFNNGNEGRRKLIDFIIETVNKTNKLMGND